MKSNYNGIIKSERYWNDFLKDDDKIRELLLMLTEKVDKLNERVYEANVRAEDAYNEMLRLRAELLANKEERC